MIILVDCNNFYASCERLFRPALKNQPVVVLSNNDGCVIARSNEAKELGIKMGAPAFLMEEMLRTHHVHCFSSNYALYGSLSNRVMTTLSTCCAKTEPDSIDEAYLYPETMCATDLEDYAHYIRGRVMEVGIPVTLGIAESKTLAKMANRFAKKTKPNIGVHILDTPEKIREVLEFTEVGDIWGVGRQYAAMLRGKGFHTALALSQAPEEWVRKEMSVTGQRLWNELHGISCSEMELETPVKKSICVARAFGQLLTKKAEVAEALANYTAIAARKLRHQNSCVRMLQIFIQTNAFRPEDQQYYRSTTLQLPVATNSTNELLHYATVCLDRIWRDGLRFKKTGIVLMDLVPSDQVQYGMFDEVDRPKNDKLNKAMDIINKRWGGKELVKFAVQGYEKKWKLRQEKLSPRYTTRISEILTVNI